MKRFFLMFVAAILPAIGFSQTAALTATTNELAPHGGVVQLGAQLTYEGQPGAVAWSIAVPAGWSLVSVSGPNLPAIAPPTGAGGVLEFAFTSVPSGHVDFSILLRYPAGLPAAAVGATAYVRADGKLSTLTPAKVSFRRQLPEPDPSKKN